MTEGGYDSMANKLIDLLGITKSYNNNIVLDDLNLYIRENERSGSSEDLNNPIRAKLC